MLLKQSDLESLKWGTACLGSGGGGDPFLEALYTEVLMDERGVIEMIDVESLTDKGIIMPIAYVGAPMIGLERLSSKREFINLYKAVKREFGEIEALMSCEIGGGNAFTPLILGALINKPVVNGDLLGRAFPEIQMSSCTLYGYPPGITFMVNSHGKVTRRQAQDPYEMEEIIRNFTVENGSSSLVSTYIMTGKMAKKCVVRDSYSQALNLKNYEIIGKGMITDIDQTIKNGFQVGSVTLGDITLKFQNEYLIAYKKDSLLGVTPDILMLLEEESLTPITTEKLMFGLRVLLIKIESPPIWKSEAGLKLVGPEAFGFKL